MTLHIETKEGTTQNFQGQGAPESVMPGRLPTVEEYIFFSSLGDCSGGVTLRDEFWAMDKGMVMAPDLPNPSPVRKSEEIRVNEYHFYCVR